MFSSTTIASSTTKPVATMSAISDRLFSEKPSRYIAPNVPTIEIGTATLGISVARQLRRNRNTTITTRLTAMMSVCSVSASDARIVRERSSTGVTWMSAGSAAVSCGSAAFTRSIVSMMFAPGERYRITSTARSPFMRPRLRRSSTESTTLDTSDRLTAAWLRYAITRSLYCAAFVA